MRSWLLLLHYGRLQLCVAALALTLASGKALVGRVQWQPALIVALNTYAIYNLDNLLDWKQDQDRLTAIRPILRSYLVWCVLTVPTAAAGAVLLVIGQGTELTALLLSLGAFSLAETWVTRRSWKQHPPAATLWGERLAVSLVWALACVLVPVLYAGQGAVAQVVLSVRFIWLLTWTTSLVWDLTRAGTMGEVVQEQSLSMLLGERNVVRALQIINVSALVLVVLDIFLGFFAWYNIAVISAPLANLGLLYLWETKYRKDTLLYCNLFFITSTLCSLLVTGVYIAAE